MFRLFKTFLVMVFVGIAVVAIIGGVATVKVVRYIHNHPGLISINHNSWGEGPHITETVEKRFKADKVGTLRVTTDAGNITVTPAPEGKDEIHIIAHKTATGDAGKDRLRRVLDATSTTATLNGETLVVASQRGNDPSATNIDVTVSYEVTAPARIVASLTSSSGELSVAGLHGGTFESSSGSIKLTGLNGDISATSESGDVEVHDARVDGALQLTTSSGDITTANIRAAGSTLGVKLKSASGNITYSGDASTLDADASSGNIDTKIAGTIALHKVGEQSTSGNIDLTLPESAGANVDASSDNGQISVDGKSHEDAGDDSSHDFKTVLGSGGVEVKAHSSSGSVEIHRGS